MHAGSLNVPSPATPELTPAHRWHRTLLYLVILVPLALGVFTFQLGVADWEDDSESCGGQIVQEMLDGQGWVLPLRNGLHIPVKPPLFYWLGALSATVRHSGVDLLDARLPSAVLGMLCVIIVFWFARSVADESVGLWSALMLITTAQFVLEARNSRVDIALCFFLTSALFLIYHVWSGEGGPRTALAAALCVGLATLSKGPLAIALVVSVMGATALVVPPAPTWRALVAPATLITGLALPALWYGAATVEHGVAFLHAHFYSENVSRVLGEHGRYPVWFYLGPLIAGGLPWMLALPWVVNGESALSPRTRRFLWVWVLAMLVFFSLSPGKRRAYLLPLRPALVLLLAGWLTPQLARLKAWRREARPPRAVHIVIALLVIVSLITMLALRLGIAVWGDTEFDWSHWWRRYFQQHAVAPVMLVVGIGIGVESILWALWQRRYERATFALTATAALALTIGVSATAIVRGDGASFRPFAQQVAAAVPATEPLAFFNLDDDREVAFLFHLDRHVPVESADAHAPCTPRQPGLYLVLESNWENTPCFRDARWEPIMRGGPTVESHHWWRLVLARYNNSAPPGAS